MMNFFLLNKKRIFVVAGVIILFFLVMDLNTRLVSLNRLSNERDEMRTEVAGLQFTTTALTDDISFATSEAAVDIYAREEAHMAQPGDVLIVPIAPPGATPVPIFAPTPTVQPVENGDVWWALFFGD